MPHQPPENSSEDRVTTLDALIEEQLVPPTNDVTQRPADFPLSSLEALSAHKNAGVRTSVATALANFEYADVAPLLLRLLADPSEEVRQAATWSLGKFGLPETLPLFSTMVHDKSASVRLTSLLALWQLRNKASTDVLYMCTQLVLDESPMNATTALQVIEELRVTPVADEAANVIENVRRFNPALYNATRSWLPLTAKLSRPRKEVSTQMLNRRWRGPQVQDVSYQTQELASALGAVANEVKPKTSRHLNVWWEGMFNTGVFTRGSPPYISSRAGYKYKLCCAISTLDRPNDYLIRQPISLSQESNIVAVAVVADEQYLRIERETVKELQVPTEGDSTVAEFEVTGVNPGTTGLEILVYQNGCLILRAVTSQIMVKHIDGVVTERPQSTIAATVMSKRHEMSPQADSAVQNRFASLMIAVPLLHPRDELLFALFSQDSAGYQFVSVRVPKERASVNRGFLGERLDALLNVRKGLFGLFRPVFVNDSFDFNVSRNQGRKGLSILKQAGVRLWSDIFDSFEGLRPIRLRLKQLLDSAETLSILQIVSDDIFLPWQLVYMNDGSEEPNPDLFWGMRLQVEQTLATGLDLRLNPAQQQVEPITAYVNSGLPQATIEMHRQVLAKFRNKESELLADLKNLNNRSAALYFYCHAEYDSKDAQQSWLELTDRRARVTLGTLRDTTRVDPVSQAQIEFKSAPLVFLNACHSGKMDSALYQSFVGFMLRDKKAGGVVGTETQMPAYFATAVAVEFWRRAQTGAAIGKILLELRRYYWEQLNNPLAFLYSLYANADFSISLN
jgi:hypothetical protein